ncbi:MAG: acetylxylan esterase [Acidobacteria bacterium]|nr:acetylxylan esterase [Acidobacteriota bacterium]
MLTASSHRVSLLLLLGFTAMLPAQTVSPDRSRPDAAANASRAQLSESLNQLAAERLAERRNAVAAITTRAQAERRQIEVREKIVALMGGLPGKSELNAKVTGSTQADGFRMEKVIFESQPGFRVTAILYLPDAAAGGKAKLPAIVVAPGHGATGKMADYFFASLFARNGFAVLSYDIVGEGERLQYPDPAHPGQSLAGRATGEHGEAGLQPTLIGDAIARYFLWDGIRAVDYLTSRPEVDPERIGAFGCSGGGTATALLGAIDTRVKAIASACYITSFDTLLPSIGPQDAEQSIPGFIASGFDLADWVELAAPRAYAVISTVSDMFPYAGAKASVAEARRFYSLFDPASAGTPTGQPTPGIPTEPTLNPDTSNTISPASPLQWITGIGGHGNLRPLQQEIAQFFLTHLAHSSAAPILNPVPAPGANASALPANITKEAFQVTPTGQVLTSYPSSETIHSITLKRYALLARPRVSTWEEFQKAIRDVTHASVQPGDAAPVSTPLPPLESPPEGKAHVRHRFTLATAPGIAINAEFYRPKDGKHPMLLILKDTLDPALESSRVDEVRRLRAMADSGTAVLVIAPRPSIPGTEEEKSPLLGNFYLTELRAELAGRTLLGLRVDDVIAAVNFMQESTTGDPNRISAQASGHLGLVLIHAAMLDLRLKHIDVDHTLESYRSLIGTAMPKDAPQDMLPGVVRRYDIPELVRELGQRVDVTDSYSPDTHAVLTTRTTP